jgi:hypothetical protein
LLLLLLLLFMLLMLLMALLTNLPQPLVVGCLHRPHVNVGIRAGGRCLHVCDDQLLMRKQGRARLTGDGEKAAAVSLILAPLLFLEAAESLLAGVLL